MIVIEQGIKMFRTKKIGVLGTMTSGKTVLLTSLLWHLYNFSPEDFKIGRLNNAEIYGVCPIFNSPDKDFNFGAYCNKFIVQGGWPAKTQDFAIARCTYNRTDEPFFKRDITFVDIPGERVSDVLIWKADNYAEWTRSMKRFWSGNENIQNCMGGFIESQQSLEQSPMSESDSWNMLVENYRKGLIALADNKSPFITPSTFVLTTDGKTMDGLLPEEISNRPIWSEGAFFPLPESWRKSQNKVFSDIYAKCEKTFKKYRKEVLKPLYNEIDDCDSFIVCVDIFNILVSGLSRFYQVKEEISNFFQMVRPGKFSEILINCQNLINSMKVGTLLPKFLQLKPPKIAYVATKSDMAIGSSSPDRLYKLLKDLVRNVNNFPCVNSKLFTCCAGKTFEYDSDLERIVFFSNKGEVHVPRDKWPELPESWSIWDPAQYQGFRRNGRPMQLVAGNPPEQYNLNKLFDFITEDND